MTNISRIKGISEDLADDGLGFVAIVGVEEKDDIYFKCFSTVHVTEIYTVLEIAANNISLMPFDSKEMLEGKLVVECGEPLLGEKAEWAAKQIEEDEPFFVCVLAEGMFACYAFGDAPMLVFMAVRMMNQLKENETVNMFRFRPSEN